MHFRCIDCLPPKQRELNHICSKHGVKITAATKRRASITAEFSLAGGENLTVVQPLPGVFSRETQRECQTQAAFVWSKQHPFTRTFRNPANQARAGAQSHQIWLAEDKKTALCFSEASYMAEETDILAPTDSAASSAGGELRVMGRGVLVVQPVSVSATHSDPGQRHFSSSSSPISSGKIFTVFTEALAYKINTGKGPASRQEKERLDFSSKRCNFFLGSSMQGNLTLSFSVTGRRKPCPAGWHFLLVRGISPPCQGRATAFSPGLWGLQSPSSTQERWKPEGKQTMSSFCRNHVATMMWYN